MLTECYIHSFILALTSPTSGGHSVCEVRSRIQATELTYIIYSIPFNSYYSTLEIQVGRCVTGVNRKYIEQVDTRILYFCTASLSILHCI
jgi:hypothetical protein